ncbi:MAG: tRNA (adenosine(37)-N6)-threonylcarbamoyltransferase complex ATPase subunit type 1 TsaE [Candidatus Nealsonbacteria bacterium]
MKKNYLTQSSAETKKLGKLLARELLKKKPKKRALVVGLEGDLGSGKTTFLQGFAKGVGAQGRVLSPTFIIMRRLNSFYHIDCYRLGKPKELLILGFEKIISNPKNTVAVEWADKVKKILPKGTIFIKFSFVSQYKRKIVVI